MYVCIHYYTTMYVYVLLLCVYVYYYTTVCVLLCMCMYVLLLCVCCLSLTVCAHVYLYCMYVCLRARVGEAAALSYCVSLGYVRERERVLHPLSVCVCIICVIYQPKSSTIISVSLPSSDTLITVCLSISSSV